MQITVSKRNCFGAALAVGMGLVMAKIAGAALFAGIVYAYGALS